MGIFKGLGDRAPDKDPSGGKGNHKGGKSQVSNTSYKGKHGKDNPQNDKSGKDWRSGGSKGGGDIGSLMD